EGDQRVMTVAALEVSLRLILLRIGGGERLVEVEHRQLGTVLLDPALRSCADRRSRVDAIAPDNARVSPTRSATPASSALPACPTRPVPSAVTVSFST